MQCESSCAADAARHLVHITVWYRVEEVSFKLHVSSAFLLQYNLQIRSIVLHCA